MILSILSGKGGTGKTTLAVSLALKLAGAGRKTVLADLDVEEPNCSLFLEKGAALFDREAVVLRPSWSSEQCVFCEKCRDLCRFNAIAVLPGEILVFEELCHSCFACSGLCPTGALKMRPVRIGRIRGWNISGRLDFLEGELDVGQEIASSLVRQTRDAALEQARKSDYLVLDAPPGTACAAREAVALADAALLVAEPTPFGLHDLRLAYKLAHRAGKKCAVVVNRLLEPYGELNHFCAENGLPVLAVIPYSEELAADYSRGKLFPENYPELETALASVSEWLGAGIERMP